LHRTWLPLVAFSVYVLAWLSRGLWLAFESASFQDAASDLEAGWSELHASLDRVQLDFQQLPVFLILGPRTSSVSAWLEAIGAAPLPCRANLPLGVFANSEAIFLMADQISQSGKLGQHHPSTSTGESLAHLCQLLSAERTARLPIQGVVLVAPTSALQSKSAARDVAAAMQADLRVVREATGAEVPIYLALSVADLPTGVELPAWFQRFPPHPDMDPAEVPSMFEDGLNSLFLQRIPTDLRERFRLDTAQRQQGTLSPAVRENVQLYQWMCGLQAWRSRLVQCLLEGTQTDDAEPGMVAGCYFLPSGPATTPDQPMWQDLLAHQHAAAWTPEALAAFAAGRRSTWVGFGIGVVGVCAFVATAGWVMVSRW
jgi:hypothetical protein